MTTYEVGNTVKYKAVGSADSNTPTSVGTVLSIRTADGKMNNQKFHATTDEPRYVVSGKHWLMIDRSMKLTVRCRADQEQQHWQVERHQGGKHSGRGLKGTITLTLVNEQGEGLTGQISHDITWGK